MTTVSKATLVKNAKELSVVAVQCARMGASGGKLAFHTAGKRLLKNVLAELGVEGEVRSNKGGPAVVGEVILHTDHVYVCISVPSFGGQVQFYLRTCKGRKDYTGGVNRWYSYASLAEDPQKFIRLLQEMTRLQAAAAMTN